MLQSLFWCSKNVARKNQLQNQWTHRNSYFLLSHREKIVKYRAMHSKRKWEKKSQTVSTWRKNSKLRINKSKRKSNNKCRQGIREHLRFFFSNFRHNHKNNNMSTLQQNKLKNKQTWIPLNRNWMCFSKQIINRPHHRHIVNFRDFIVLFMWCERKIWTKFEPISSRISSASPGVLS